MSTPRVLLVAKPWRGGLAHYLLRALRRRFAGNVVWIPSYPHTPAEGLRYRLARASWRQHLLGRINATPRDLALFLNLPADAEALVPRPGNVLWLTDAPQPSAAQLAAFERILVSDTGHLDSVRAAAPAGAFAGAVSFACDPEIHRPAPGTARRDVCFIGNRDSKRDVHLEALLTSGASATVVGNYFASHPLFWRLLWRRPTTFRPRVAPARMAATYARHRVSLNVHAAVVRAGTNMRTFEAAACDIAQLVELRPGLEDLFEPGREIVTYREPSELPEALDGLLRDDGRRRRLAARARKRVLAQHTYDHRLDALLGA